MHQRICTAFHMTCSHRCSRPYNAYCQLNLRDVNIYQRNENAASSQQNQSPSPCTQRYTQPDKNNKRTQRTQEA